MHIMHVLKYIFIMWKTGQNKSAFRVAYTEKRTCFVLADKWLKRKYKKEKAALHTYRAAYR